MITTIIIIAVLMVACISIAYIWTESEKQVEYYELDVIGKTIVRSGFGEKEVCILEDGNGQRMYSDGQGCLYNKGEHVLVKKISGFLYIEGIIK